MGQLGTIAVHRDDDVVIVRLLGEHDLATRPAVLAQLRVAIDSLHKLIIDVTDTDFIDASILSALITADHELARTRGRLVLLTSTSCGVQRTLEVSGVVKMLPVAHRRSEAVAFARTARADIPGG